MQLTGHGLVDKTTQRSNSSPSGRSKQALPALKGVVAKLLLQETAQIHVFTVFLWFMAFLLVEVSRMVGLASLPLSGGTEGGCGSVGCCAEPTAGPSSGQSPGFVWRRAAAAPSLLPR